MRRRALVQARNEAWKELETLLNTHLRSRPEQLSRLAALYRGLASDLMCVRRDRLGQDLEAYLDRLASRAHNRLYANSAVGNPLRLRSLLLDFPGAVRRNWRLVLLSTLLFFGPAVGAGLVAATTPGGAARILGPAEVNSIEAMHSEVHRRNLRVSQGATATGFYINHNVSIAFRTFAVGVLFGVGSAFNLVYNGLNIGAAIGHLIGIGRAPVILGWIAGHSAWELIAIVLAGAAGMQLGLALLRTGGRSRLGNARAHGLELLRQVAGFGVFLLMAAVLEAWVAPSSLPNPVKYAIGGVGLVTIAYILGLAGRDRPLPEDVRALQESR